MSICAACNTSVESAVYHDDQPFHSACLPTFWGADPLGVPTKRPLSPRYSWVEAGGQRHVGGCYAAPAWPER